MNAKFVLPIIALSLITVVFSSGIVSAAVSVGVKEGDWIEYSYSYTGSPPDYNIGEWIRFDFTKIEGTNVTFDLTGKDIEGNNVTDSGTFDIEIGGAPSFLIIPANLDVGDQVYYEEHGSVTIAGKESGTYVDAKRTTLYATVSPSINLNVTMYWDKTTGVLVYAEQPEENYTLKMTATRTNMWQPQPPGQDTTLLYALLTAAAVIVAVAAIFMLRRKKSPQQDDPAFPVQENVSTTTNS